MTLEVIKAKVVRDLTRLQENLSTDEKDIMVQAFVLDVLKVWFQFL